MGAITRRHLLALLASAAVLPALAGCDADDCKPPKTKTKTPTKAPTKTPTPRPS